MKIVSRKWIWPINAIVFNFLRLLPIRNKKLWVFGAHAGEKYDDNARFMFEYINSHHKHIRAVWLANHMTTVERIRNMGYEAYRIGSIKGELIELTAGVALYTHSIYDFGFVPLIGGAEVVALWHGVGFKIIYNEKYKGFRLWLKVFLDTIYTRTYRNITLATSQYMLNKWKDIFHVRSKDIYITGQPRNDIFKQEIRLEMVFKEIAIPRGNKIVAFLPTYRSLSQGYDAMEKIIDELYFNKSFSALLEKMCYTFIVKLHPLTPKIKLPSRNNFLIIDYESVELNQELLCVSDILITDYSSCFVDFSLQNRPIIFYTPDHADYLRYSGQNDKLYDDITKLNKANNIKELIELLKAPSNIICQVTNDIFEDPSIRNTCYSENVYRVITNKIGV